MRNVLLIDDSEDLCDVINEILSDAGYSVAVVDSPEKAHAIISTNKIDVILCDLVMPLDKGSDVEESFEEDGSAMVGLSAISDFSKQYPKIPIIAISGELTGEPLQITRKFGALLSLAKPFGRDQLLKALEAVMQDG